MYLEQIGANCQNCGNMNQKGCGDKCLDRDYSNWEPAAGIKVQQYDVWHGKKKGRGRRVIHQFADPARMVRGYKGYDNPGIDMYEERLIGGI
jgi:hypothetical protein